MYIKAQEMAVLYMGKYRKLVGSLPDISVCVTAMDAIDTVQQAREKGIDKIVETLPTQIKENYFAQKTHKLAIEEAFAKAGAKDVVVNCPADLMGALLSISEVLGGWQHTLNLHKEFFIRELQLRDEPVIKSVMLAFNETWHIGDVAQLRELVYQLRLEEYGETGI